MIAFEKVDGYCPMGCGATLFLGDGGHVTCSLDRCPDPTAAGRLLAVAETEHLVELGEHDFRVIHPLRERLTDDPVGLLGCDLELWLRGRSGPPMVPGRYRVRRAHASGWDFERLGDIAA